MDRLAPNNLSLRPETAGQKARAKAEDVANQFEAVFVQMLVSTLRSTASLGGEEGGMFGQGPGAETYAGWFDKNVADELTKAGGMGVATSLIADMERHGALAKPDRAAAALEQAADESRWKAADAAHKGGFDVVL